MTTSGVRGVRWGALAVMGAMAMVACPAGRAPTPAELQQTRFDALARFETAEQFDQWAAYVGDLNRSSQGGWGAAWGCAAPSMAKEAAAAPDESITNNQEQGVDEGDIVKAVDDWLVVLRRGRLFSVRLGASAQDVAAAAKTDAFPRGYTRGTWYDELLIYGRRVVVVGYSYKVDATELGLFRLEEDGRLVHEATHFLTSNDYYSSRNYASRLIGNTLVFYMPYSYGVGQRALPSKASWEKGDAVSAWSDVLKKVEIYKPVQPALHPVLHTVVRCDLDSPKLDCTAQAVVGPWARTFYVSRDAVYVFVGATSMTVAEADGGVRREDSDAVVYRLPLLGGDPTALRAQGMPIDQFSFKEADGQLNVVLTARGGGDAMWAPERTSAQQLGLLRAPLGAFSATPGPVDARLVTRLPGAGDWGAQNRFVGEHLLWGSGSSWGSSTGQRRVFVTRVAAPEKVAELTLSHDVDRLEALGADAAAVVGSTSGALVFSAIRLDGEASTVGSQHSLAGAVQGEWRSHGFFFKPQAGGGGTLGLPVRLSGSQYSALRYGSANVTFLSVAPDLTLSGLGALSASPTTPQDDACKVSCADWYGNARPIFYRGRVWALLGYELVEGEVAAGAMVERGRLFFLDAP